MRTLRWVGSRNRNLGILSMRLRVLSMRLCVMSLLLRITGLCWRGPGVLLSWWCRLRIRNRRRARRRRILSLGLLVLDGLLGLNTMRFGSFPTVGFDDQKDKGNINYHGAGNIENCCRNYEIAWRGDSHQRMANGDNDDNQPANEKRKGCNDQSNGGCLGLRTSAVSM